MAESENAGVRVDVPNLSDAKTEDDFRVVLAGSTDTEILEYVAINIFQLRKVVDESIPALEAIGKNPMLKAFFPKVK